MKTRKKKKGGHLVMSEGEEYIIQTQELHIHFNDMGQSVKRRFNVKVKKSTVIHHGRSQQVEQQPEKGCRKGEAVEPPQPRKASEPLQPQSGFFNILSADAAIEQRLERLHSMIDGHRGQYVALVIVCAWESGWFDRRPTYRMMRSEFGDIGARSNFHRQLQLRFSEDEKKNIINKLLKDMPDS